MINKIRIYFSDPSHKKLLPLFLIIAILITLPLAVFLSQQQQTYRQHASRGDIPSPTPIATQPSITNAKEAEEIGQLTNRLLQGSKSTGLGSQSLSQPQQIRDLIRKDLVEAAKKRKELLLKLAEKDPRLFLALALKKNTQPALSPEVQAYTEKEVTVEGKTEVLHIDDFKNPANSKFSYFLKIGNQRINLFPTQELSIASGAKVRIKGIQLDSTIVTTTDKASFQVLEPAPQPESVGDQKTLVLLIRFQNSGPEPFTKEKAHDLIFNGQFQKFYKEQSYNQVSFSGDVFGWFTLNYNATAACGLVLGSKDNFSKIVRDNNIDLAKYSRLVFVADTYFGGCSSVGKYENTINDNMYRFSEAALGAGSYTSAWGNHPFQWTLFDFAWSHELGHSLGVWHANGWDCKDQTLYGNCQHIEYGNHFDTMGYGYYSLHFNSFYKELLGWINPSSTLLINTSGTYTLNPLELDSNTKLAKIKLQGWNTPPFYLEYRRSIGFDAKLNDTVLLSNQSGLFINRIRKYSTMSDFYTHLLDMTPTSLYWNDDIEQTTLNDGNIFTDPDRGITLGPITKADNSSITFDVKLESLSCTPQQPLLNINYYSEFVPAGKKGYTAIEFTNKDSFGCGESEFKVIPILPSDWNYDSYPPGNISLESEQTGYVSTNFSVPENAPVGNTPLGFDIINIKSGLKTHSEFNILIKPPVKITKIDPEKGPVGTKITIFGSGLNDDPNTNTVYFFNYYKGYHTEVIPEATSIQDGVQKLQFTIPDTICPNSNGLGAPTVQSGGEGCSNRISTPLDIYSVSIYAHNLGESNYISFEVTPPVTPTPTPFVCTACAADVVRDGTGVVNINDITLATSCFGKAGAGSCFVADINKDGIVNIHDITCISSQSGKVCSANITPTPTPKISACTTCSADINKDGIVDQFDLNGVLACFGKPGTGGCAVADINKDGIININDITCVSANFKKTCSSTTSPAKK